MSATCPTAYLEVEEATCAALPDGYGLSAAAPLRWGSGGLEPLWYGRLECADGTEPLLAQIPRGESAPASDAPISTLGRVRGETDILDLWSVRCGEEVQTWYVDLYHCGSPCPPKGASLIDADAFALYQSSVELARIGQRVGATGAMARAVEVDPGNLGLWTWLGSLQLSEGRLEESLVSFDAAMVIAPESVEVQLRASVALYELGEYQKYLDVLEVMMNGMGEYDPRRPELTCRRAQALMSLERTDEAMIWAARSCAMGFWPCCEDPGGPVPPG